VLCRFRKELTEKRAFDRIFNKVKQGKSTAQGKKGVG